MSGRVMHLERALGGVMCRLAGVPSRWQRTSDPAQMTCSRCRVVYRMYEGSGRLLRESSANKNLSE